MVSRPITLYVRDDITERMEQNLAVTSKDGHRKSVCALFCLTKSKINAITTTAFTVSAAGSQDSITLRDVCCSLRENRTCERCKTLHNKFKYVLECKKYCCSCFYMWKSL